MTAALSLHVALSLRLDAIEAYRLAHAYRDEVAARTLREAADLAEQRTGSPAERRVLLDFATQLRREANVREEATAPAATTTPDFFEPGHSYTHRNGTDFRCVAVTTHPQTGELLAMGWHIDSWSLHYPATVGINQWRHEYDGVQAPTSTGDGAK